MWDVCVVGPVTRDVIAVRGAPPRVQAGGAALYAGLAYARLGLATAVLTKVAEADAARLLGLLGAAGIAVIRRGSQGTAVFENTYGADGNRRGGGDDRVQRIRALAPPFRGRDLTGLRARVIHLGPLTRGDMAPAVVRAARRTGARVALDVQGMVRRIRSGAVRLAPPPAVPWADVHFLKANIAEARSLAGVDDAGAAARRLAALGPREVIVTRGPLGAVIAHPEGLCEIQAVSVPRPVDPTGCGDTFVAGYVYKRLGGAPVHEAGRFAAALAACALERVGPFAGTEAEVVARLG